jgi:hypothetical protein
LVKYCCSCKSGFSCCSALGWQYAVTCVNGVCQEPSKYRPVLHSTTVLAPIRFTDQMEVPSRAKNVCISLFAYVRAHFVLDFSSYRPQVVGLPHLPQGPAPRLLLLAHCHAERALCHTLYPRLVAIQRLNMIVYQEATPPTLTRTHRYLLVLGI